MSDRRVLPPFDRSAFVGYRFPPDRVATLWAAAGLSMKHTSKLLGNGAPSAGLLRRQMRGLKRDRTASVVIKGHAPTRTSADATTNLEPKPRHIAD
jgi:hypothetical protein